MIDVWIGWTLLAASMQAVRTAAQKQLTADMSAVAATLTRYLYGIPFVVAYILLVVHYADNASALVVNTTFLVCATLAAVLQIVATVLLIRLFTLRNFAVGSTYARTEVMLTAVLGVAFFGELISFTGWLAIAICAAGLICINIGKSGRLTDAWNRSAAIGLGSGLCFSLTSLFIRKASLSFGIDSPMLTAGVTLTYMVLLQTALVVAWVAVTDRTQLRAVVRLWRTGLFVGATSVAGSAGWFTAFTLERASYVKTLGQVEFLITLGIAVTWFRERPGMLEMIGMLFILTGVVVLLLSP